MLNKKILNKVVAGLVVTATIASSGVAVFAAGLDDRVDLRKDDRHVSEHKIVRRVAMNNNRTDKFLEIVEKYDAENLDAWKEIAVKKDAFKSELVDKIKSSDRVKEAKEFYTDLKVKIDNEEITREDAREMAKERSEERREDRQVKIVEFKEENAEKIESAKEYKSSALKIKVDILKAVKEDDAEAVKAGLDQLMELIKSVEK